MKLQFTPHKKKRKEKKRSSVDDCKAEGGRESEEQGKYGSRSEQQQENR